MDKVDVYFILFVFASIVIISINCHDDLKWRKKDVRDYTDADLERLYEQWEEADEPLEEDELPEWKREAPKIDMSKFDANDPESMMKQSKVGRTLMMFVSLSGNPKESETQEISQLWQSSLFNAHYETQRYVVGSDRVLFTLKDGSKAWEIKDFLISQDRCLLVTIEGKDYYGKAHPSGKVGQSQYQSNEVPKEKGKKKKKKNKKETHTENSSVKPDKIEL